MRQASEKVVRGEGGVVSIGWDSKILKLISVATYRISGLRSLISTSVVTIPMTSLVLASLRAMVPDEAKVLEGEVTDWIGG